MFYNLMGLPIIGVFTLIGVLIGAFVILYTGGNFTGLKGAGIIGLLGLIGSLSGTLGLYYQRKQLKLEEKKLRLEEPRVNIEYVSGSYILSKYGSKNNPSENKDNILLNLKIRFKNNSNSLTSITDLIVQVSYNEEIQLDRFKQVRNHSYEWLRAERLNNQTSLKLEPNCGGEAEYRFEIKDVNFISLQRCLEPINIWNPQPRKEWEDLPVYIEIIAKAPINNIKWEGCIYREDQEESKKIGGPLDYADF